MKDVNRSSFYNINLFLLYFLALSGYYVILILISNNGLISESRLFTIPIRLIVLTSLIVLFYKTNRIKRYPLSYKLFLLFAMFYLVRIFIEAYNPKPIYMSEWSILLYFLSFVLLPFVILSNIWFTQIDYRNIFLTTLLGAIGVALVTYFYYGSLLGNVNRITEAVSRDENFISPLALSYCSVLGISISVSYLLTNKVSKFKFLWLLLGVILCLVPFFLGSSRGSIFAVTFPFIIYFVFSKGLRNRIRLFFTAVIFIFVLVISTDFFGHGVFDRFASIFEDINTGNTSAIRVEFWKDGIRQFAEHPFFGNSLQSEYALFHPHNIFIEILISTGLLGFIPFFIFIVIIFRNIVTILRTKRKYFWVTNIFIIGFIQNMFTGAIWGAGWTIMGAAMIISIINYNPQDIHQPI